MTRAIADGQSGNGAFRQCKHPLTERVARTVRLGANLGLDGDEVYSHGSRCKNLTRDVGVPLNVNLRWLSQR